MDTEARCVATRRISFVVCHGHATEPVRLVAKFFSAPGPRLMLPIHFRGGVHPSEAGSSLNTEKLRLSPCLRATNCCHLNVTELTTRRHVPDVIDRKSTRLNSSP